VTRGRCSCSHALARQQLAARRMPRARTFRAAEGRFRRLVTQLVDKTLHCSSIALKARGGSTYLRKIVAPLCPLKLTPIPGNTGWAQASVARRRLGRAVVTLSFSSVRTFLSGLSVIRQGSEREIRARRVHPMGSDNEEQGQRGRPAHHAGAGIGAVSPRCAAACAESRRERDQVFRTSGRLAAALRRVNRPTKSISSCPARWARSA